MFIQDQKMQSLNWKNVLENDVFVALHLAYCLSHTYTHLWCFCVTSLFCQGNVKESFKCFNFRMPKDIRFFSS